MIEFLKDWHISDPGPLSSETSVCEPRLWFTKLYYSIFIFCQMFIWKLPEENVRVAECPLLPHKLEPLTFHLDWVQILPNNKSKNEPWLLTSFLIPNWRADLQLGDELVFVWIGPVWAPESILEVGHYFCLLCSFFVFLNAWKATTLFHLMPNI